jgi:cell division protein FtsL
MTIVQPDNTNAVLNRLLIALVVALVLGAGWLVVAYNRLVNLNHGLTELNAQIRTVQTENAEIKDKTFELFASRNLEQVALNYGLVTERQPRYIAVQPTWSLASR